MGVSIHIRGRLDKIAYLPSLCDEVGDIADSMGWPATRLNDDWSTPPDATLRNGGKIEGHLGLKGIQITPHPDSEPFVLFVDREGYLRSPMTMVMILNGTLQPETAWVPLKTQFAGPDLHVWVIGLLKYLKKHYISNLEVLDESEYWDTGDRRKLEEGMTFLNERLQDLSGTISSGRMGYLTGLSAAEIAERIKQYFLKEEDPGVEYDPPACTDGRADTPSGSADRGR